MPEPEQRIVGAGCRACGATDTELVEGDFLGKGRGLYCKDAIACEVRRGAVEDDTRIRAGGRPGVGGTFSRSRGPTENELMPISIKDIRALERFRERTTALFYVMLRDATPYGMLFELVQNLDGVEMDNDALRSLAEDVAARVASSSAGVGWSKATRDWIDGFPDRIKGSAHFEPVLQEMEGVLQTNDSTRAAVSAEVVARERAARS